MARTKATPRSKQFVHMQDLITSYLGDSADVLQLEAEWRFKAGKQLSQMNVSPPGVVEVLGALPDAVMHHILKLACKETLARLALTSKAWARYIAQAVSLPSTVLGLLKSRATTRNTKGMRRLLGAIATSLHPCEIVQCNAFGAWTMEATAELMACSLKRAAWTAPLIMEMATRSALDFGWDFHGFNKSNMSEPEPAFLLDVGVNLLANLGHFVRRLLSLDHDATSELFRYAGAGLLPPQANAAGLIDGFVVAHYRDGEGSDFAQAGKDLALLAEKLMPMTPRYLSALVHAMTANFSERLLTWPIDASRDGMNEMSVAFLRALLPRPVLPISWGGTALQPAPSWVDLTQPHERWPGSSAGALLALAVVLPLKHEILVRDHWEGAYDDVYDMGDVIEIEADAKESFMSKYQQLGQMSHAVPASDIPLILEQMVYYVHAPSPGVDSANSRERVLCLIDQFLKGCWLTPFGEVQRQAALQGVEELKARVSDHIKPALEDWLRREDVAGYGEAQCSIL